jgi:hypothetical protein
VKHLTGFGAIAIAALLFALAYITGVKGVLVDCIAHTCTTLQLPQPLSFLMGALLAAAGFASLYVALRAFQWRHKPSPERENGSQ